MLEHYGNEYVYKPLLRLDYAKEKVQENIDTDVYHMYDQNPFVTGRRSASGSAESLAEYGLAVWRPDEH